MNILLLFNQQQLNLKIQQKNIPNANIVNKNNLLPPEQRSATSVIASILSSGYKLSKETLDKAKAYDERVGFSQKVITTVQHGVEKVQQGVQSVDAKLGISQKAKDVSVVVTAIDQKLGISTTTKAVADSANTIVTSWSKSLSTAVEGVVDGVSTKVSQFVEANPTLQSGVNKIRDASRAFDSKLVEIKIETNRLIDEENAKKSTKTKWK